MKAYDKSPVHSPPISRNNSTTSIGSVDSTQSEPTWDSYRRESNTSQASANTTASHKKSGFKGLFGRQKDPAKEEKKRQQTERIVLGSKHAAAVKTKMMMDPEYKKFQEKHHKPQVKTAGITDHSKSAHSSAAAQEARHPHSGPPALHGALDLPSLDRIESHDEPDDEVDYFEAQRREWEEATDKMAEIPEIRSRAASRRTSPIGSPWASPSASREPSPNRLGGAVVRPALGSKRNSWAGGYRKDEATGRWKKTPPSMTPVLPDPSEMNPDLLARSLAERLNTHA